jgi:hypothetical protein
MTRPARRARASAATMLVVALAATACSGSHDAPGAAAAPSSTARPAPVVKTAVSFGTITGRLPASSRDRLKKQVRDVVDGWADAAYLGGTYPRRDFTRAWPGFTAGAREDAHRDRALMSNQDIARRIDGVRPRRSKVRLDVLAVHQRPVGITARVLLGFRTTGELVRRVTVRGDLYLTYTRRGWQVFGYDISKGAR